jgi:tetratricopeptide (TPR) repeat protein
VPTSADEAKKLVADAKAKFKAADWEGSYEAYSRLGKSNYLKKDAQLGMAHSAWQMNQVDRTIKHAQAAVKAGAGVEALKMLGHAYFKKGNYQQALVYYDDILKNNPGDKEVSDAAKAARKRLKK